ncbi:hypothetical protein LAZ67_16002840 [Cordylochernes scorpioides]|uniref:BHLH domain-containing protein n=1 Tax=Cordylochernes scorpioides TaxID=51811 RepID=A0ABY6LD76_9ARAC|nr:hypothetical protein LAZ67_16002840 [Cordylochernes scorpioides]
MCGTSLKTINNIIHKDLELDTRRKGKVHKLTPFHMKNRATNARKLYEEHLAGSRSEYTATLDEAWMYVTYCNGIRKICYIKRGNQVPDNWVHQCSETFLKGFMVVGVMTGRGVLPLIKVPSKVKVNSEFYIECVLKPVIEQLKDLYPGEMDKVFLHHDKASSHTSNKTQQFLQEMKDTLGLNFIRNSDIPVKSPDASPLDFYGFGMLKQRLFNRRPKTEAGLWKAAQEEWSNVSLSKVKEVFAAWKVRCREIAKKKGKHIEHMKKIHEIMDSMEEDTIQLSPKEANSDDPEASSSIKLPEYNLRPRSIQNRIDSEIKRRELPKRSPKSKPKPAPLSKYRRKTANARERTRMQEINTAFERLRNVVPHYKDGADNSKLPKITTLRLAVNYIAELTHILNQSDDNTSGHPAADSLESSLHLFMEDDDSSSLDFGSGLLQDSCLLESDGESIQLSDELTL